jgi:hypothetical protein
VTRPTPIPDTVTLHVPFRIVKRGGRKEMQLPSNAPESPASSRRTDSTLIKALARGFRWKRMLDAGKFTTIAELAEAEGIARSYLTRILRLTFLAPDLVEAILDGRHPASFTTEALRAGVQDDWETQRCRLAGRSAQCSIDP